MRLIFSLLLAIFSLSSFAQTPASYNSSQIYQQIKKLDVLGSVLYLAAHPDDENTALLAWLSNQKLYRTAYLSMTRGDGGQNLLGDEQGESLGLIRTQELLSARRIDGAEQFFTRAFDFGYTKSPVETLELWGHQEILSDVVWVIRKFQPDIIITRFPTTGEGGHGHHTASAILASEAFKAAADPSKFPEQFQYGVKPWQAKRLLWNTFNFGRVNTTSPSQFHLNIGGFNPLLGESYGEIAAQSRSQHKSQGFGIGAHRGTRNEYFRTIMGSHPEHTLMDDVTISWDRLQLDGVNQQIEKILQSYSFEQPENSLPKLVKLYQELEKAKPGNWRNKKLKELKNIIKECAGLYVEATTTSHFAVQGDSLQIYWESISRLASGVHIRELSFQGHASQLNTALEKGHEMFKTLRVKIPDDQKISQPYWLRYPKSIGAYTVKDQRLIGMPENPPPVVKASIEILGATLEYEIPVQYKSDDPVKGETYQPLFFLPKIEVETIPSLVLSVNNEQEPVSSKIIKNSAFPLQIDTVWKYPGQLKKTLRNGVNYFVGENGAQATDTISLLAKAGGSVYDQYKTMIQYPHIPDIIYFQKSQTRWVPVNLNIAGKKVGYIGGAGDKVPDALKKMGYEVVKLAQQDITAANLAPLDAIVTGVRAYDVHPWLQNVYGTLMIYVRNGGVLLVQYNRQNISGSDKVKIGPYPFSVSRNRVTNEEAPVTFKDPGNTLLNVPNKITQDDFINWIQERSTYEASAFEKNYKSVLSMHDAGEPPTEGSLIYTDYGKGRFIYTGLVFFRELPAGVPGAYRLFANLLATPQTDHSK